MNMLELKIDPLQYTCSENVRLCLLTFCAAVVAFLILSPHYIMAAIIIYSIAFKRRVGVSTNKQQLQQTVHSVTVSSYLVPSSLLT